MAKFIICLAVSLLIVPFAFCYEPEKEEVPEGMEIIEVGAVKLLAPKGARIIEKAGLVILEDTAEYVARRLEQFELRMDRIEAEDQKTKQQLRQLEQAMEDVQARIEDLNEPDENKIITEY